MQLTGSLIKKILRLYDGSQKNTYRIDRRFPDGVKKTVYDLLKKAQQKQVERKLEGRDKDEQAQLNDIDRHFFWFDSDLG